MFSGSCVVVVSLLGGGCVVVIALFGVYFG